eukprot:jgi/Bigna1/90172/estExt_fgenesh1_pg.C_640046
MATAGHDGKEQPTKDAAALKSAGGGNKKKKRKRKGKSDEDLNENERERREVQFVQKKTALAKSLTFDDEFLIKERRRRKLAKSAHNTDLSSKAHEWRKKTFGAAGKDSRFVDERARSQRKEKLETAASKGAKHDLVIIPIFWKHKEEQKDRTIAAAERIKKHVSKTGLNVWIDARHKYTPGQKFAYWEHLGVLTRVEIGPGDIANATCSLRHTSKAGIVAKSLGSFPYSGRCQALIKKLSEQRKQAGLSSLEVPSDDDAGLEPGLEPAFEAEEGEEEAPEKAKVKKKKMGTKKKRKSHPEDALGEQANGDAAVKKKKKKKNVVKF